MADPLPLDSSLPDTTGISEEDRRDIVAQIDKVAQQNRLQAGPEVFTLTARKKGLLVPVAVNLGALVVLLAGLGTLWLLFRQGAETLVQNQVVLQSTEGKLIEELKKQSETQLLAKDQQIADIQQRMDALARQKNDLQATMDDKIASREAELKQQLQKELEAERARLTQAGFSQAVVEEKLRSFEKQKTAEFQQQLAEFKKSAEAERLGLEANLKKQQDEFQKNLSSLAGERQKILEDSKKKQNELQAQLDQKSRDLEAQKTSSQAELAKAQQQLNDLNEQRSRTESVQNQLLGLYTKVAQSIQTRQFGDALKQVQSLVNFVNEPSVRALPDIQKRRDADLLLAASLSDWLTQDQKRLDDDAARLQVTQSALDTIQTLQSQAQQALASGKDDTAEALYQKALTQVPAVLEAHQYFVDKALKAEQTRQAAVVAALAAGDAALIGGDAAGAVRAYSGALDALPVSASQRSGFIDKWGQAQAELGFADKQTALDESLKRDLAAADAWVKAEKPTQALAAYVALLAKYPVGQVGFAALTGLRQVGAQLQAPNPREVALNAELSQVRAELAQARADLEKARTAAPTTSTADAAALQAAQAEAAQLKPRAAALDAMAAKFQDFASRDAELQTQTPDSAQILQSKLLLNAFLNSPEMGSQFPGLADRLGRLEKSALEAGQREGLINVGDAVANLGQLATPEERKLYLAGLQRRYAGNPALSSVLKSLAELF